ncbi:MAG: hypothetical protein AB2L07_19485 [Thermoanaerobaculaceae bacterium]
MDPLPESAVDRFPGFLLPCPACAAPVHVAGRASAVRCDHCGTAHLVVGRTETLTLALPDRVADGADALAAFLTDMQARRLGELTVDRTPPHDADDPLGSELAARLHRRLGAWAGGAAEAVHTADAAGWAARLSRATELLGHRRLLAPYWHLSGRLVEAVVGRDERDDKRAAAATTAVELSARAFAEALPLPPLGRLSWLRELEPVPTTALPEHPALCLESGPEALASCLRRSARQRLVRHLTPMLRHALAFPRQRHLVLRPLHLLALRCRGRDLHLLLEGASRRILDRLPASAAGALWSAEEEPLPAELGSALALRPMRCPVCGWDLPLEPFGEARFCRGCGRAVAVEGLGATTIPYSAEVADGPETTGILLPFWRFGLRLEVAEGGRTARTPGEVLELLAEGPAGRAVPDSLDVPAFRPLDRHRAAALCQPLFSLGATPGGRLVEGPVRGAMGFVYPERPVTVPASEARHLGRAALLLALPAEVLLRAPAARIERVVLQSRLELGPPRLVLRKFRRLDVEPLLGPAPGW